MKKQFKKILMIIGISCLINTIIAQSGYVDDVSDDFFEFVVVEQPDVVTEEESLETESDAVENAAEVDEPEIIAESSVQEEEAAVVSESDSSIVVPMVSTEAAPSAEPVSESSASNGDSVTNADSESGASTVDTTENSSSVNNTVSQSSSTSSDAPAASTEKGENTSVSAASAYSNATVATSGAPENDVSAASNTSSDESGQVNKAADVVTEPADDEAEVEEEPVDEKAPSRSVTIKKKQYLDVTYPGEGWLYMGDENNSKALSFKGREQKGNTTLLKFYSDRAGEALLHFCKQDILTDTYIHDYLLVTVSKTSGNKQHIKAPEYIPAPAVNEEDENEIIDNENADTEVNDIAQEPSDEIETETQVESEQVEQVAEEPEPEIEDIVIGSGISLADEPDVIFSFGDGFDFSEGDEDDYYQQLIDEANDAFFAGRGQEAVDKAQIIIDDGSYFSDEALYIQAQVYETDSALLDVNKSYGLYKTIVDYYPESSLWSKASKRVTYLERYYFSIR